MRKKWEKKEIMKLGVVYEIRSGLLVEGRARRKACSKLAIREQENFSVRATDT